jgi:hypothetical protein
VRGDHSARVGAEQDGGVVLRVVARLAVQLIELGVPRAEVLLIRVGAPVCEFHGKQQGQTFPSEISATREGDRGERVPWFTHRVAARRSRAVAHGCKLRLGAAFSTPGALVVVEVE